MYLLFTWFLYALLFPFLALGFVFMLMRANFELGQEDARSFLMWLNSKVKDAK